MRASPEDAERLVEKAQVLHPVHEEATERVVELLPVPDVDVREGPCHLLHPARVHVEAELVQEPAEVQEVVKEVGHHLEIRSGWRAALALGGARSGRLRPVQHLLDPVATDLAHVLLVLEDDAERLVNRRGVELLPVSATSAATQSSVSETPVTLYSSARRSS